MPQSSSQRKIQTSKGEATSYIIKIWIMLDYHQREQGAMLMNIYIYGYIHVDIYIRVYIFIYMYICICIHTQ